MPMKGRANHVQAAAKVLQRGLHIPRLRYGSLCRRDPDAFIILILIILLIQILILIIILILILMILIIITFLLLLV